MLMKLSKIEYQIDHLLCSLKRLKIENNLHQKLTNSALCTDPFI